MTFLIKAGGLRTLHMEFWSIKSKITKFCQKTRFPKLTKTFKSSYLPKKNKDSLSLKCTVLMLMDSSIQQMLAETFEINAAVPKLHHRHLPSHLWHISPETLRLAISDGQLSTSKWLTISVI